MALLWFYISGEPNDSDKELGRIGAYEEGYPDMGTEEEKKIVENIQWPVPELDLALETVKLPCRHKR